MKRFVFQCVAAMLLATPLLAADIVYPPWDYMDPSATYQGWEFYTPEPMPMPDFGNNPFGFSPAEVHPLGQWMPEWEVYNTPDHSFGYGVWPLSGEIVIPINNVPKENEQKLIWIQLTWMPADNDPVIPPFPMVEEIEWNGGQGQIVSEIPFAQWMHTTYEIVLPFNPPHEIIRIWGDIWVDEVVIDTLCTPEPATMGLLAAGGVLALIRRKR